MGSESRELHFATGNESHERERQEIRIHSQPFKRPCEREISAQQKTTSSDQIRAMARRPSRIFFSLRRRLMKLYLRQSASELALREA